MERKEKDYSEEAFSIPSMDESQWEESRCAAFARFHSRVTALKFHQIRERRNASVPAIEI